MNNIMRFGNYSAVIQYDPEINLFRGEFLSLNGGADFYASDVKGLKKEGKISLDLFLKACKEDGISPHKQYSGKFNLRLDPILHEKIAIAACSDGMSINQWVNAKIQKQFN